MRTQKNEYMSTLTSRAAAAHTKKANILNSKYVAVVCCHFLIAFQTNTDEWSKKKLIARMLI